MRNVDGWTGQFAFAVGGVEWEGERENLSWEGRAQSLGAGGAATVRGTRWILNLSMIPTLMQSIRTTQSQLPTGILPTSFEPAYEIYSFGLLLVEIARW